MDETDHPGSAGKPIRFVLYFPLGSPSSARAADLLRRVEDHLCRTFGGLTSYPARGMYLRDSSTTIQRENVQALEIYANPDLWTDAGPKMHELAAILAGLLDQESVAISVEGTMIFKGAGDHAEAGDGAWLMAASGPD
jgi:hypothetical protein